MNSRAHIRSVAAEPAAVTAVAATAGLLAVAALTATLVVPVAWVLGLAVVSIVAIGMGALARLPLPRTRETAGEPAREQRLLVVADARCSETVLCDEIQSRLDGAASVHLVVPVRSIFPDGDGSAERHDAEESLLISVRLLQQRGVAATGSTGAAEPFEAMAGALARFPAARVLLAIPPGPEPQRPVRTLPGGCVAVVRVVIPTTRPEAPRERLAEAVAAR